MAGEQPWRIAAKRRGAALAQSRMTGAPAVEVVWMPDTIHDIPLQRPAALAERMVEFLQTAEARAEA